MTASAATLTASPLLRQFADRDTGALSYLLACPESRQAIIIDPLLEHVPLYLAVLDELDLKLTHVLDTHIHADHTTGSAALRTATGARICLGDCCGADGYDQALTAGEQLAAGSIALEILHTPGHTPGCLTFRWRDRLFTGDCLLIGGAGGTDEPGGDPGRLFDSITRNLLPLPDETLVYPGHDTQGRRVSCIGEERRQNPLFSGISRDEFISRRAAGGGQLPVDMKKHLAANLRCGAPA